MQKVSESGLKQTENVSEEKLIRIFSKDIEGGKKIYAGLTKIKGVSWAISNAICKKTGIEKSKKIGNLTKEEIAKINHFMEKMELPENLLNRRKDFETGNNSHLLGSDLDLKKDFDIKRLKKIKSYRGLRHSTGQPSRGQRTKAHFRENRKKGAGIKKNEKKT